MGWYARRVDRRIRRDIFIMTRMSPFVLVWAVVLIVVAIASPGRTGAAHDPQHRLAIAGLMLGVALWFTRIASWLYYFIN